MLMRLLIVVGMLSLMVPGWAHAQGKTGFGVYIGGGQQDGSVSQSGAPTTTYSSDTDLAYGVDLQLRITEPWTASLFYEATTDTSYHCNGCGSGNKVSTTSPGVELRYWLDMIFVGVRALVFNEQFTNPFGSGTVKTNYSGSGLGLTAGIEGSGGNFIKAVYETPTAQNNPSGSPTLTDHVEAWRLFVGHRF